ncbi:MAG: NAD(P)-dependent oxidoreductase [Chloroflexi bacterium]|nr:NAD(P)-dependent oxidoreductase [Chloroflexota bacterium]
MNEPKQKILVTGMSGLIGGALRTHLENDYELTAHNRSNLPGVRCFQADIADFEAIQPAFVGQDVVVHLSANAKLQAPWEAILQTNIIGTYNVLESARRAGVKRVIYASSGATVSALQREFPYNALVEGRYEELTEGWPMITHESPTRPSQLYGVSKVFGEVLARHFTDTSDLSVICLRFGVVNDVDLPRNINEFPMWCSQRDAVQMVQRCIAAPATLRYDIFFVTSDNKWGYRDLSHAREVVGYAPVDAAENYR